MAVRGAVQGVGFRPFVYRLAGELGLAGWVSNGARGVELEVEGERSKVRLFRERLESERPRPAVLQSIDAEWISPTGEHGFHIAPSHDHEERTVVVLPDLAICDDCRREIDDPSDRRHRYPFTNCTNCGPRFSILLDLPYDRPQTTMRDFVLCPACRSEYEDPSDRRFHAQPVACPACGPRLRLVDAYGVVHAEGAAALAAAVQTLRQGRIVALKGLGGYQLLVDALDDAAVRRLRERKRRPSKPLAVLVRDLEMASSIAHLAPAESALLASPEAPIVLVQRRPEADLSELVAPGHPNVGLLLPTTPLHVLVAREFGAPLVATSGNLIDEPIATDDRDALVRLRQIADRFLAHDRPIARHVDDGVSWIVEGAPQVLRRARGVAPLPELLAEPGPTLVAVGAHQKDAVALAVGRQVFLSQHIGDMEMPEARAAFERVIHDLVRLYEASPEAIAHDLHPDYPTTIWARSAALAPGGLRSRTGHAPAALPLVPVQHHHAHLAALVAEHELREPLLAFTWDGTGYGPDGTVWGGEALLGDALSFERVARLRPFRLPGGEAAVREPRRSALGLLWELEGEAALERDELPPVQTFSPAERHVLGQLLASGSNAPETSSVGRLFDGVAALVGLPGKVSYEGEAASRLEFLAAPEALDPYPLPLVEVASPEGTAPGQRARTSLLELDWRPLVAAILADLDRRESTSRIAARFHAALAAAATEVAQRLGATRAGLTGGCFQNRRLTRELVARLDARHIDARIHRRVPANDGGIALGQAAVARARMAAQG